MKTGDRIQHYRLQHKLGEGGQASVWLAQDEQLQHPRALKFFQLPTGTLDDLRTHERILREPRTLAKLRHPNVVTIHHVVEQDDNVVVVMEYMEGGSLRDRLRVSPEGVAEEDLLRWGINAAEGLAAAHDKGILHRDIKPDNLFLTEDDQVCVGDFGLARQEDATVTIRVSGTIPYMSPEQIANGELDARSDIFALGATLFELATGDTPYEGLDRPGEVPSTRRTGRPISDDLDALIRSMIARDVESRPSSAAEVAEQLRTIQSGGEIDVRPVDKGGADRSFWRKSGRWALAMVPVVVVTLLVAWYVTRDPAPSPEPELQRLAIFPLAFNGAEERASYSEDSALLLGSWFSGSDFELVDQLTLQRRVAGEGTEIDADSGRPLAKEYGANFMLVGDLREVGGTLTASAALYDLSQELPLASVNERADDPEEFVPLIDRMATELLRGYLDNPTEDFVRGGFSSRYSLAAIKEFLKGHRAERARQDAVAAKHYKAAVSLDSTFAEAWYKVSWSQWISDNHAEARTAAAAAVRHGSTLSHGHQALLRAVAHEMEGDLDEAENEYRAAIGYSESSSEAWLRLGNLMFQQNADRGRSMTESRRALERVYELDPHHPWAWIFLRFVYARLGERELLRRELDRLLDGKVSPVVEYMYTYCGDDIPAQESVEGNAGSRYGIQDADIIPLIYPDNHRKIRVYFQKHFEVGQRQSDRAWFHIIIGSASAGMGEWSAAMESFDSVIGQLGYARVVYEVSSMAMALPFTRFSEEERRARIAELEAWDPSAEEFEIDPNAHFITNARFGPLLDIHEHMRLYVLGALHAQVGDHAAALAVADNLEAQAIDDERAAFMTDLASTVRAAVAYYQGDAELTLHHLSNVQRRRYSWSQYAFFTDRPFSRYLQGKALEATGDLEEAIRWLRSTVERSETNLVYNAPVHLDLARIKTRLDRVDEARAHYQKFLHLYENCDPEYQDLVLAAQTELAALDSRSR